MTPNEVLEFWFKELSPKDWFSKNDALDAQITLRFSDLIEHAKKGQLNHWRATALGRLAEILVLDQFSRNIFRGQVEAFVADDLALQLAQEAISVNADQELSTQERSFLYMPFMHSESVAAHEEAVQLYDQPGMELNLEFEMKHKVIIDRFGRYPHRNKILGRDSTTEEINFLTEKNSSF